MDLWRSINKEPNMRSAGIHWALPKIIKLPLINGFTSHAALIPLISSLCSVLKLWSSTPLISSLLCPLRAATSLSVVSHPWIFFLFFFFLRLLQRALICIFYIFLFMSNLIWEIHFEGRDLINKTPSNTNLLPKTTKYQHWSKIFLFFYFFYFYRVWEIFFQILHALFLLMIYLFSCRVLKIFLATCFVIFFSFVDALFDY